MPRMHPTLVEKADNSFHNSIYLLWTATQQQIQKSKNLIRGGARLPSRKSRGNRLYFNDSSGLSLG
jgi:hypothetical protein